MLGKSWWINQYEGLKYFLWQCHLVKDNPFEAESSTVTISVEDDAAMRQYVSGAELAFDRGTPVYIRPDSQFIGYATNSARAGEYVDTIRGPFQPNSLLPGTPATMRDQEIYERGRQAGLREGRGPAGVSSPPPPMAHNVSQYHDRLSSGQSMLESALWAGQANSAQIKGTPAAIPEWDADSNETQRHATGAELNSYANTLQRQRTA